MDSWYEYLYESSSYFDILLNWIENIMEVFEISLKNFTVYLRQLPF